MKIDKLSDEKLLDLTEKLVLQERELTLEVIRHLREIEQRRLFSDLGYSSLYNYCTQHLKYSEAQAHYRISAMRLAKTLPEVEEKIEAGALSLTTASLAQNFFRREKVEVAEQKRIVRRIEGQSKRACEKILISESSKPSSALKERTQPVTEKLSEVRFYASDRLLEKLDCLKGQLVHKKGPMNYSELIEELCDQALEKVAKRRFASSPENSKASAPNSKNNPKTIPARTRRQIFQRDQNKCTQCGSTYALEVDHILPRAKGGTHHPSNLELTCRSCNQRRAIRHLGKNKMRRYLGAKVFVSNRFESVFFTKV